MPRASLSASNAGNGQQVAVKILSPRSAPEQPPGPTFLVAHPVAIHATAHPRRDRGAGAVLRVGIAVADPPEDERTM